MIKYLFYLVFLGLFGIACSKNLDIPQEEVAKTLLKFEKENTENQILIKTKFGQIYLKLYDETPLHRANFIRLIKSGFFDEQKIYRIVRGLCIQGGGSDYSRLTYLIPSEFRPNLIHKKGALSMARYSVNNPKKMSSATEFFIVTKGENYTEEDLKGYSGPMKATYLEIGGEKDFDNEYTVFGEVTKGIEVAEKISRIELVDIEKPLDLPKFSIEIVK
jgi:cyclophilin family peptidyl-prolyl cis-trans isomerase